MEQFGAKKQANVENPDESKQQGEPCKQKKRGRKPKLTKEERRANKNAGDRKYRKAKKAKTEASEKEKEELKKKEAALLSKIEELEKEKEADLFKISSLNKELSEIKDRADQLARKMSEMSDESKKLKMAGEALESKMRQLQQNILDPDDQENSAENCQFNIPRDDIYLNSFSSYLLEALDAVLYLPSSETKGITIAKAKLPRPLPETVNVNGFNVRKENFAIIQKIFSEYPNIASGLKVHCLASRDCFMSTLAEVYKMVMEEKHTLEEIKSMEEGIEDLELVGLEISWLKDLVKVRREVVQKGKNKNIEVELKERQSKAHRRA